MEIKVQFYDYSNVYIDCDDSTFFELRDYFSFESPGYRFNPKYKRGVWDGRIRLLGYDRLLPYGLYKFVIKFADQMEYKVTVDPKISKKNDVTEKELRDWIESKEIYSGSTKISPHWYQTSSVVEGLTNFRSLLNLPTSAGKSLIQALLARYYIENYQGKVLILVPTTTLVDQMINDFVDYRLFPRAALHGIRSGTKKDSDALIYVSTWQSAIKQPKEWFHQFGMFMNDEAHKATGQSITTIIKGLVNCRFKFGLTGSLKDGKANIMQYIGLFGDIYKPVSTKQLMDDGKISKLKINTLFFKYPAELATKASKLDYANEIKLITKYSKRNKMICSLAAKLATPGENVFIMFNFKEHGTMLYEYLKTIYDPEKVFYMSGDVKIDDRNDLKILNENETGIITVASYGVFSTGVSIKQLHHVIFAHPVKSKITVLQSIGRVLRKHSSKSLAVLWDIVDDMGIPPKSKKSTKKYVKLNYALKHALERIQRYAEEQFDYVIKEIKL